MPSVSSAAARRMLGRRDAEAGVERYACQGAGAGCKARERGRQLGPRARRPRQRHEIEPSVRLARGERDALVRRCGRDELDALQLGPRPCGGVGDDEARCSRRARIALEALPAVGLEQRRVRHRDQWRVADEGTRGGKALEAFLRAHAGGERFLGRGADDRPVCERIRERKADLDDVRAARDRGLGQGRSLGPGHQVDDERLAIHERVSRTASASARSLSPRPDRQTAM